MRSSNLGEIPGLSKIFPIEATLDMFRRMCLIRYFELNVKKAYDQGLMPKAPIYLSVGQETISAAIATMAPVMKDRPSLFGQHRGHDIYLAFGGDPIKLIDELLGKPTGCAGGMGGSASIHCPEIKMIGHDGLMGTQVADSVGSALGTKETTITFMGDASAEEGFVLGSIGFAVTKKLPILFVVCDNNLSILTKKDVRRNWAMANHANFGMPAVEITDDPWLIMHHVKRFSTSLPALINIHVCRELWHAGTGKDSEPEWNRFEMVKQELNKLGLGIKAETMETVTRRYLDEIWNIKLKEPSQKKLPEKKVFTIVDPKYKYERNPSPLPATANKVKVKEIIQTITRDILENRNGVAMGECLTAVGWVGGTVPDMTEKEGLIELSMDNTSGSGIAVGCSRLRPTIYIVRYQGFQWFNGAFIANLAAKSKEMWGISRRLFVRSVAMEGGIGPVAGSSHHGMFTRMPGIAIVAPMTPGEYMQIVEYFNTHNDPMYVSEHRRSFDIDYEMLDIIHNKADITLIGISAARLNILEAVKILEKDNITCNVIHLLWLKPFQHTETMISALNNSTHGGIVFDTDFENGVSKCIAHDLMLRSEKKVQVLGLEERTAGFAPYLDNLPPSPEKIYEYVKRIVKNK